MPRACGETAWHRDQVGADTPAAPALSADPTPHRNPQTPNTHTDGHPEPDTQHPHTSKNTGTQHLAGTQQPQPPNAGTGMYPTSAQARHTSADTDTQHQHRQTPNTRPGTPHQQVSSSLQDTQHQNTNIHCALTPASAVPNTAALPSAGSTRASADGGLSTLGDTQSRTATNSHGPAVPRVPHSRSSHHKRRRPTPAMTALSPSQVLVSVSPNTLSAVAGTDHR